MSFRQKQNQAQLKRQTVHNTSKFTSVILKPLFAAKLLSVGHSTSKVLSVR